ncbi:MAG: response regulator transcription factor [bacterium]|nr:response regulator transcription factor [bacterium]
MLSRQMEILVIEDELNMGMLLKTGLTEEGHSVVLAPDGVEGLGIARDQDFDVIVLDLMLPRLDGLTVAKLLREDGNQTPILMLTAKDTAKDVVTGLDTGADDYLTKPFSFEELLARLRAVTRRGRGGAAWMEVGDLRLDPATRVVTRADEELSLTRTEFSLLELLLRRVGHVVPRETIIRSVWGFDSDVENNTLDVFMSQLRRKVDPKGAPRLIHTVRGFGYSIREPES